MPILMWPLEEARAVSVVRQPALLCLRGSESGVMAVSLSIFGPGTSLELIIPGVRKQQLQVLYLGHTHLETPGLLIRTRLEDCHADLGERCLLSLVNC
jgi:hypothetical protein